MYEHLKGKRLLVLGGTRITCGMIKRAREMGLTVGVVDYYPAEQSPGKQLAHEAYDASTTDVDAVVQLIRDKKFDGLVTGCSDMLLPYYAEICAKAGLYSLGTKEQYDTFVDKEKYKALCKEYGVPAVEGYDVENLDRADIRYPVFVKPADGSGSRGISICNNREELMRAVEKAKAMSRTKKVVVERYMTGREVTVNWLFVDGDAYLTGIANRHVKRCQGPDVLPLPVGYTYPASVTPIYRATIEQNAKRMFKAFGVRNGVMFMQCKLENDTCVVYDIGYRLSGTQEYINFADACGFNPMEMIINYAITGKMCEEPELRKINPMGMKPSFNVSFLAKPGTIGKIEGIEEAKAIPELADIVIAHYPGETITEKMRGLLAQISVRAFGSVEKKEQLFDVMKKVEKTVRILSTEGELMNLPGIEKEDLEGVVL